MNVRNSIHAMTEDASNKERLYVTNEDIVGLASINSDTVFAVTAPQGTSLVVPDPESDVELGQPRNYRCIRAPCILKQAFSSPKPPGSLLQNVSNETPEDQYQTGSNLHA